eukprot:9779617-Ditylum_brightwellii.AAC.1
MRTVLTTSKQSNPDVKWAVILFPRAAPRQIELGQFHAYKLRTTLADVTSPTYELSVPFFDGRTPEEWIKFQHGLQAVLKGQNVTQGPASYAVAKTLLKGGGLTVFEQTEIAHGNQTVPHFNLCLDDVAEHVFHEKASQIQKRYMHRNNCYGIDNAVKEWVAQVQELNGYLKDFPAHNRNPTQPLGADELLVILEFGVRVSWHREFTVQGFDPMDKGLRKFVEFCTHLESCEPSKVESKGEKPLKLKTAGKCKAKVLTTPTASSADMKFY